ncbi:hypothetical protein PhaeoP78_02570 [Phaeobacter inhibens]|nr:hypothetical protein PhaeoP78_02570 [Phaeobacter inhibens]
MRRGPHRKTFDFPDVCQCNIASAENAISTSQAQLQLFNSAARISKPV